MQVDQDIMKVLQNRCDDMVDKVQILEVIKKYLQNPNAYDLTFLLTKYMKETEAKQLINYLNEQSFWPKQSRENKNQPSLQQIERTILANHQVDFKEVPECQNEMDWPVEKQLLKCLIHAYIAQCSFLCEKLDAKYFPKKLKEEELKEEVEKLKRIIDTENRTTQTINKYFQQLEEARKRQDFIYDSLLAIKSELIYIDVADLLRLIKKTREARTQVQNRDIVLFIGDTGSGKTTSIMALLGYKMGESMFRGLKHITIVEPIIDKKVLEMDSNPECRSVTRYVVAVKPKCHMTNKDIYLTDTSGFGAAAEVEVQIANNIAISTVFRYCRSVVPAIVISKDSWGPRGGGFRNLARTLSILFKNYGECKESVVVMMNRFTDDEIKQMPKKLKSLIQDMGRSDSLDKNYIQFLKHLKDLADKKQLWSFDILKDEAKEYLNKRLLTKQPLFNPSKVFNHQQNNGRFIKKYCQQIGKITSYHLKKGNINLLNYFLQEVNKFYSATRHDFLSQKSTFLKNQIQKAIKQKLNRIISEFNSKVSDFRLCEEDFNRYFNEFTRLKQKDYCRIINNGRQDYHSSDNIRYQARSISARLMDEINKQTDIKIEKYIEILRMLCLRRDNQGNNLEYILKQTSQQFSDKIQQLVKQSKMAFAAQKFDSAVCLYENAMKIFGYNSILHCKDNKVQPQMQYLKTYLLDHIKLIWQDIDLEVVDNLHINIEQLKRIDSKLIELIKFIQVIEFSNSYRLMGQQQRKQIKRIKKLSEQFIPKLKHISSGKVESIAKMLNKTRTTPIQENEEIVLKGLFEEHQLMKGIPSFTQHIESQTRQILSYFEDYMQSQRIYLINLRDQVAKGPRSLINQIADIRSVLIGRMSFVWLEVDSKNFVTDAKAEFAQIIDCFRSYTSIVSASLKKLTLSKFENNNFQQILIKANDIYTIYCVYKEVKIFEAESQAMRQANEAVESMIASELKRAASLIETLCSEVYKRDGLIQLQQCLNFFQLVHLESPYSKPKLAAKEIQILAKFSLEQYAAFLEEQIQKFQNRFLNSHNQSEDQNQETTETMNYSIRTSAQRAWLHAKRCLRAIRKITRYCPRICKVYPFNLNLSERQLINGVKEVYRILKEQFNKVNEDEQGIKKLSIMIKKTEQFTDEDSGIIGETVNHFKTLNGRLIRKIIELQKNPNKQIIIMLKQKQFYPLKCFLKEHKLESQAYRNMLVEIQKYLPLYEHQKRQNLNNLSKEEPDRKIAIICLKEMKEINYFLNICWEIKSDLLAQYSTQLEQYALIIKSKISQRLSNCLEGYSNLGQANRLAIDLQQLEKYLPGNVQSKGFRRRISQKLQEVQVKLTKELTNEEYNQLYEFFKRSQNQKRQFNQLQKIRRQWHRKLDILIETEQQRLRHAKTMKQFIRITSIVRYFIKFLPNQQKKKKITLFISYRERRLQSELQRQDEAILPFSVCNLFGKLIGNIDIQRLRKIQDKIEDWSKRRIQQFSMSSLGKINELFCTEVSVYIKRIEEQPSLRKFNNIIQDRFIRFYKITTDKISKQINKLLIVGEHCASMKHDPYDQMERSPCELYNQIERSLCELYNGLLQFSSIVCSKFIERITDIARSTYGIAVNEILRFYDRISKSIHLQKIFTNKTQANFISEFKIVDRLQKTITIINSQLKNQQTGLYSVDSWDIKEKVRGLALGKNIITQFVSKLQIEVDFVKKFNFQKLANADKMTLQQMMNRFKNSVQLIIKNREIYDMLVPDTLDMHNNIQDFENSLKQQAKRISQDLPKHLYQITSQHFIQELNHSVLKLDIFERVYGEQEQYVSTIINKISYIIKATAAQDMDRMVSCQDICLQHEQKRKILQDQQQQAIDRIENEYQAQINQIAQEMNARNMVVVSDSMNGPQQENRRRPDSKFNEKIAKLKQIKNYYKLLYDNIDKECFPYFQIAAKNLIRFKMAEMNIKSMQQQSRKNISNYIIAIEMYGKKYVNMFAKVLEQTCNSYALKILKENLAFNSYNVKLFKRRIKNFNQNEILANTRLYLNDLSLNIGNQRLEKQKHKMSIKLARYYQLYDAVVNNYRQSPDGNDNVLMDLKESIKSKALEVKRDQQSKNDSRGYELVAQVFALWTISKARNTNEGIKFLYYPHPSQVVAIFVILGFSQENLLSNRLAEVQTGEGKSVILAVLACYLALIGYQVNVVCYSRLLSERDERDFRELFKQLQIEEWIQYGTFEDIGQKLFSSQGVNVRLEVQQILLNNINKMKAVLKQMPACRKKILLADEVDVLFSKKFFGWTYRYGFTIKSKSMEQLASYVWVNKSTINYKKIVQSREFKACIKEYPDMEDVLIYQVTKILQGIQNYQYGYVINNQRIESINGTKMSWQITFAYYYEAEKGRLKTRPQDEAGIILNCGKISYAELPNHFEHIMGVSATLHTLSNCKRTFLKDWYKIDEFYQIPSVYGQSKRKYGARVVQDKLLFRTIFQAISAKIEKGRPVLVFFLDLKEMNSFYFSKWFKSLSHNAMILSEKNDFNEIKKCIDMATCYGRITISTRAFARGIDFVVEEKKVRDAGGVHVIQTFTCENVSESVHIQGRTARQGEQGSLQMILSQKTVQSISMNARQLKGKQSIEVYNLIKYANKQFEKNYETLITTVKNCKDSHIQTMKFLEFVKANDSAEVRKQMKRFNKY